MDARKKRTEGSGKFNRKQDLYTLLHQVSIRMGRGSRQGLAVRPGQNKVLKTLEKYDGEMRQRALLDELGIRAGSLSELLRKLEDDGYIERRRNEQKKSEIIVSITERGHISALESRMSEKERDVELFSCLDDQERADLARILTKLLDDWDEKDPETEGARRERRWLENAAAQAEQREINALLDKVTEGQRQQ